MNKDNMISSLEWDDFRSNFVIPFENAGRSEDYRISIDALNEALNDPIFKGITHTKEVNEGLS